MKQRRQLKTSGNCEGWEKGKSQTITDASRDVLVEESKEAHDLQEEDGEEPVSQECDEQDDCDESSAQE